MLKGKHPSDYHQMLPYQKGTYEPRQNIIDFGSAKEILMEPDKKRL